MWKGNGADGVEMVWDDDVAGLQRLRLMAWAQQGEGKEAHVSVQ